MRVLLELERLRNPNSGLGVFCRELASALLRTPPPDLLPLLPLLGDKNQKPLNPKPQTSKPQNPKTSKPQNLETPKPETSKPHLTLLLPEKSGSLFGPEVEKRFVHSWHKFFPPKGPFDIWHCTHQDSAYWPAERGTPVVLTIHDLNFLENSNSKQFKTAWRLRHLQKRVDRAAAVVFISRFTQARAEEHLKFRGGQSKTVIYNGVSRPSGPLPAFLPPKKPFVFSIGLHPKKNYEALLPLLARYPDLEWRIAGDTRQNHAYCSKLLDEAARLKLHDRFFFLGPVSEAEKWWHYQHCTALWFPSRAEGFGLPALEAMQFGKPVFLSRHTSLPEIGGSEAYYFEDFEPDTLYENFMRGLSDMENDPEKPQKLKNWAAHFSWEKAASDYQDLYYALF